MLHSRQDDLPLPEMCLGLNLAMTKIVTAGVAVVDFVFFLDEMPRLAEKYRANGARDYRRWRCRQRGCGDCPAWRACDAGEPARLDDQVADMIVAGLEADGVDCALVRRFEGRTVFVFIGVCRPGGERQIVNFRDQALPMDADWLKAALPAEFDAALADTRWPDGAAGMMRTARERGLPGVLDARSADPEAEAALYLASHLAFSAQGLRDWAQHDDLDKALADGCGDRMFSSA
jgi:sulfofructose kinase